MAAERVTELVGCAEGSSSGGLAGEHLQQAGTVRLESRVANERFFKRWKRVLSVKASRLAGERERERGVQGSRVGVVVLVWRRAGKRLRLSVTCGVEALAGEKVQGSRVGVKALSGG